MVSDIALVPIALLSSALAAVMGMGGGVLLIAIMPGFISPAALFPVHAATQLASNASRVMFGWQHLDLRLLPAFVLGALAGGVAGGAIYQQLDLRWLPLIIALVILWLTWAPRPHVSGSGQGALVLLGFYQTGLGMLAGATGPLGAALLSRHNSDRDWLVVNTAAYMSVNHVLRLLTFIVLGFSFAQYWQLMVGMIVAVVLGSWLGTQLRHFLPQRNFALLFKGLLTVLALRLIALPWLSG